jgi:hypothetical protein
MTRWRNGNSNLNRLYSSTLRASDVKAPVYPPKSTHPAKASAYFLSTSFANLAIFASVISSAMQSLSLCSDSLSMVGCSGSVFSFSHNFLMVLRSFFIVRFEFLYKSIKTPANAIESHPSFRSIL